MEKVIAALAASTLALWALILGSPDFQADVTRWIIG